MADQILHMEPGLGRKRGSLDLDFLVPDLDFIISFEKRTLVAVNRFWRTFGQIAEACNDVP